MLELGMSSNSSKKNDKKIQVKSKDSSKKKRARTRQNDYNNLKSAAHKCHVNVDNVFADTDIKVKHLKEIMNYSHLWLGKGKKVDLDSAEDNRIGEAYKKCYYYGE